MAPGRAASGLNRRATLLPILAAPLLAALGGGADTIPGRALASWAGPRGAEGAQTDGRRTLQARTSTGRQGAYFLPRNFARRALPLMVAFPGTGGKGSLMILRVPPSRCFTATPSSTPWGRAVLAGGCGRARDPYAPAV
jgi:hypothetical protein